MEKEWKWIRNISLIQNIMVSLFYVGLIVTYLLFDAVVKGLFEHIDVQRRGEIDDEPKEQTSSQKKTLGNCRPVLQNSDRCFLPEGCV